MYLEKIDSPADVKKLTVDEMTALAEERLCFSGSASMVDILALTSAWWKPLSQCTMFLSPLRIR